MKYCYAKISQTKLHCHYPHCTLSPILTSDLEYSSLVWGEEVLTLLCPPAGEEPYLALPELIQKASLNNIYLPSHCM